MAIYTVHPYIQVHRFQMYCFFELLWIFVCDWLILGVHQGALAVPFEYGPKVPAMPVVIRKLRVFEFRVQFRHALGKLGVSP